MLVFVSDLHLNDGSSGANLHPGAFHIFAERLRYFAARASWRADGSYRPLDRIDLVLLGDVLDLIRSERWHQNNVRPWGDLNSPAVLQTVTEIVDGILHRNEPALAILRSLATQGLVCVAPAGRNRQPIYNAPPQAIPLRIYYMVGNSDWLLHVPGRGYDLIRQKITHQMALANPLNQPLPHDPAESDVLLETFRQHRVLARHGDIFDPINFTEDRNASSLGDALAIQLISRFPLAVSQELGASTPTAFSLALRELDHIRPQLLVPVWLEGVLERTCPTPAMRKQVKQVWDQLAEEFLQLPAIRQHDAWKPADMIDGLELALKFSRRTTTGWVGKLAQWLNGLRGAHSSSYCEHALAESDFRNRRACHIVYGHTHVAESLPLDASYADGFVLSQMYFNTGTWRRVYQPTQLAPGNHEFIPLETMSYVTFFEGDERGGRPFEMWSGSLGVAADEIFGPPQPAPRMAATQLPATRNPIPTPHFNAAAFTNAPRPAR